MKAVITSLDEVLFEVQGLLNGNSERVILGIIGKPGAGKSTVTDHIFKHIDAKTASFVPMDGFHLSNQVLHELGRAERKGAPDTFDASGFTSLLSRIRNDVNSDIYFPIFHREIEESIAAEGVVRAGTKLVVTEGNYLLLQNSTYSGVKPLLDESWYLQINESVRHDRLIARHQRYGKDSNAARAWALGSDENNAVIIGATQKEASRIVNL